MNYFQNYSSLGTYLGTLYFSRFLKFYKFYFFGFCTLKIIIADYFQNYNAGQGSDHFDANISPWIFWRELFAADIRRKYFDEYFRANILGWAFWYKYFGVNHLGAEPLLNSVLECRNQPRPLMRRAVFNWLWMSLWLS